MSKRTRRKFHRCPAVAEAFTRLELLALLAAFALLTFVAFPLLAGTRSGANRAACVNNLSRIGRAFSMWASDHGQRFPCEVEYPEGTRHHPEGLQNNVWFQFGSLSNELATADMLACPTDAAAKPAKDFSSDPAGGLLSPSFRNLAISYFVSHPFVEDGRLVLAGDRNLDGFLITQCSYFNGVRYFRSRHLGHPKWSADLHGFTGNLLFVDGSVEQPDNASLRDDLTTPGVWHFIAPR